jgi:hypothetical protein
MSVEKICERSLGLLNAPDFRDLDGELKAMLENLDLDGLVAAYAPREAVVCARHFAGVRDALLAAHPWVFARKTAAPAQLAGNPPAGWKAAFSLPADCLKTLAVTDTDGRRSLFRHYEVAGRILAVDRVPVYLTYTARVADTNAWDAMFADAFCARLAGAIAASTGMDPKAILTMEQMAAAFAMSARAAGIIAEAAQPPFEFPAYLDYAGVADPRTPFWV